LTQKVMVVVRPRVLGVVVYTDTLYETTNALFTGSLALNQESSDDDGDDDSYSSDDSAGEIESGRVSWTKNIFKCLHFHDSKCRL